LVKKNHQNRTRVDFVIMFYKNVVLYEIYSKILVTEYLLHVSVGSIERKLNRYKLFRVSAVFEIGENFSELLFDFDDFFLPTKVELNVVLHCNFIIYKFYEFTS
jgi:hypothetical protein